VSDFIKTEEEEWDLEELGTIEFLEERGWDFTTLIDFEWETLLPMSNGTTIRIISFGEGSQLICVTEDLGDVPPRILAKLEPANDPELYSAFFKDLLSENGAHYGIRLFGSLPSVTSNGRAELISQQRVEAVYHSWMDWANMKGWDPWVDLRASLLNLIDSPDDLDRALRALEGLPSIGDPDAVDDYLEKHKDTNDRIDEELKRLIMHGYFSMCYQD